MTPWDLSHLEMREVIHGKMLRKETISIILHDIDTYFPGKRALKTDWLIEEQWCSQLELCQRTPGSIIAPQQSLKADLKSGKGQSATLAKCCECHNSGYQDAAVGLNLQNKQREIAEHISPAKYS